jgi:hypothetical protein
VTAVLDLIPSVAALAPSAPEPLVIRAYIDSAREFFRKTMAWVDQVDIDSVGATTDEYLLDLGDHKEVVDGVFVRYQNDEKGLTKITRASMVMRSTTTDNRPRWYRVTGKKLHLGPNTGTDVSAEITAILLSLRPTLEATEIDDEVAEKFHEYLEAGALYRLLTMPNKPWTDVATAGMKYTQFQADIDEWRARAPDDGMTGIARRVKYGGL